MAEKISLALNLKGRVQGVFFRKFLQAKAQNFDLSGIAKNEDNGSLSVVLEGEKKEIFRFLPYILSGPPLARVEKITLKYLPWKNLKGFTVE